MHSWWEEIQGTQFHNSIMDGIWSEEAGVYTYQCGWVAQCEVVDVEEEADGMRVTAMFHPDDSEQEATPQEKIFRVKYVVACDGGSSPLRKRLGVHLYGLFVLTRACSISFTSPELFA